MHQCTALCANLCDSQSLKDYLLPAHRNSKSAICIGLRPVATLARPSLDLPSACCTIYEDQPLYLSVNSHVTAISVSALPFGWRNFATEVDPCHIEDQAPEGTVDSLESTLIITGSNESFCDGSCCPDNP